MSAIYGIYRWGLEELEPAAIVSMGASLRHRGNRPPDCWQSGSVALGSCLLITTHEAAQEHLPYRAKGASLIITSDVRIDNRKELISDLNIRVAEENVTDSALILAAYEKWGETCPAYLLGDFAFAIWDANKKLLFCARDHFGVKPLYYWSDANQFIFSTEISAILRISGQASDIDRATVASFLVGLPNEDDRTFYENVKRVRKGCSLTVSGEGCKERRYYALDPTRDLILKDDREYAEAFSERFHKAVARRMRSSANVGCMLSGGLDSSAVTCVAATVQSERVGTFSHVFSHRAECDESAFIEEVLRSSRYDAHRLEANQTRGFSDLERLFETSEQPSWGLGFFMLDSTYAHSHMHGYNVILDGHGGDEVVSLGVGRLREMALRKQWVGLTREWLALGLGRGDLRFAELLRTYVNFSILGRVTRRLSRMRRTTKQSAEIPAWREHINVAFAEATDLNTQYNKHYPVLAGLMASERQAHFQMLSESGQSRLFEDLDYHAGASTVEARYPFWDKELVEFCLSLPPAQKLSLGKTRAVMRRALVGVVPEKVRTRSGKTNFGAHALACIKGLGEANLRALGANAGRFASETVSREWFFQAVKDLFNGQETFASANRLWRCISILTWLEKRLPGVPLYNR